MTAPHSPGSRSRIHRDPDAPTADSAAPSGPYVASSGGATGSSSVASAPSRHPAGAYDDVGEVSVGELVGNVTRDLSTLMRQELALAQAEVKAEVSKTGKAAGALGAAVRRVHGGVVPVDLPVVGAGQRDRQRLVGADRRPDLGGRCGGALRQRAQEAA